MRRRLTAVFKGDQGGIRGHSRPQSPRSFWPVAGIESSGLVQLRKSAIHGLPVKSGKSDWFRIRNEYTAHTQKIGSSQSSRSLPQARRIVGSGDENDQGTSRAFRNDLETGKVSVPSSRFGCLA